MLKLAYENRKSLYHHYDYTTDVITMVGGMPEGGWENYLDAENLPRFTLYGVELEVSTDYNPKDIIDAFSEIFAICKKDRTISGNKKNMMEIVTIPASLRHQKRMWSDFFKNLDDEKFDTLDKHTNGMHVHVDRKAFDKTILHDKKFVYFFTNPANEQFLREISERDGKSIDNFCKFAHAKNALKSSDTLRALKDEDGRQDKHVILNIKHPNTFEVRIFKGIVSFASVIKNLEFVDSVVEFTRITPMNNVSLSAYIRWINRQSRSAYRILRMCLDDMNLGEMLIKSEYQNMIVVNRPKDAVMRLNMASAFTGEHVAFIMSEFAKIHGPNGWEIQLKSGGFDCFKSGTRFAKYNDHVKKMYNRNAA